MSEALSVVFVIAFVAFGVWGGWTAYEQRLIQDCRTTHNVWACEVIAVPLSPTPSDKEQTE